MSDLIEALKRGKVVQRRHNPGVTTALKALQATLEPTELTPDAPAPKTQDMIADLGAEPSTTALAAWNSRLNGTPIIDVAHKMGLSIQAAKSLLNEVHAALRDDLKANLELNRELDLQRIDSLLAAYLEPAKTGDIDAARLVLKALAARAELTGAAAPKASHQAAGPQNVLVWIQSQLPSINRLVDSLPPA